MKFGLCNNATLAQLVKVEMYLVDRNSSKFAVLYKYDDYCTLSIRSVFCATKRLN